MGPIREESSCWTILVENTLGLWSFHLLACYMHPERAIWRYHRLTPSTFLLLRMVPIYQYSYEYWTRDESYLGNAYKRCHGMYIRLV